MKCCDRCRPLNSARMFKNPAPIFEKAAVLELLSQKHKGNVIELGAGCLRNSMFLARKGFHVSVLEVEGMEARFPENFAKFRKLGGRTIVKLPKASKFDLAVATFVIETVCEKHLRAKLIRDLSNSLLQSGCLIISVRGPADLVTARESGKPCSDGYLTPGYSFARSYTRLQLLRLLNRNGFGKVHFLHKNGTKSPELLYALAWRNDQ